MKAFIVLALVATVSSRPEPPSSYGAPSPSSSYGAPGGGFNSGGGGGSGFSSGGGGFSSGGSSFGGSSFGGNSGFGGGSSFGGSSGGGYSGGGSSSSGGYSGGGQQQGPQVFRHVYVHAAPDEQEDRQSRVIRVPGGQDKHVNIIFVKAPSASSSQQTEVILPEQDTQKTLVYVLLKKGENSADVKIRQAPKKPLQKPEVFFIRYANGGRGGGAGGYGGGGGGSSSSGGFGSGGSTSYGVPSTAYGIN